MRKSTYIICILLLSLTGCRSANKAMSLLAQAESQMLSAPDSALYLLNGLDPNLLTSRSVKARHALLFSQALDKNGIDMKSDSVIAPAVAYYAHHGDNRAKAFTNYYLGRIRNNTGDAGEAAMQMMTAEKYAVKARMTNLLGLIYNCRANLYYSQYSFDEALTMYDKADSCFRLEGKMGFSAFMLKAKAKILALQSKNKASIVTYRKALNLFDSIGNSGQACLISSTLAFLMKSEQHISTDTIKQFLSDAYSRYTSGITPKSDYPIWAWIHFQENKIDSAQFYVNQALAEDWRSSEREVGLLALACQIDEAAGNYRKAATNWRYAYQLRDSISDYEKINLVQHTEEHYENKALQHQNEMLHIRSKLILCFVALIFTVLASAFVLTYRHWRRIMHNKSEETKQYKMFIDKLSDDYTALKTQYDCLSAGTNDSREETHLLLALEKRLTSMQALLDMAYTGGCKPQTFFEAFKKYASQMNNEEFAFSDLQFVINKRYNGVIDYLRRKHPGLTTSELNMLCMMLYGFSNDCMRTIFNHENVDSIYSRRTKIREKLGLPPRTKPEKYLQDLAEQLNSGEEPQEVA